MQPSPLPISQASQSREWFLNDARCAVNHGTPLTLSLVDAHKLNAEPRLALGVPSGETFVVAARELPHDQGLLDVLGRATVIGHDLKVPLRHLLESTGHQPPVLMDTGLASSLLCGVKQEGPAPDLEALVREHLDRDANAIPHDPAQAGQAAQLRLLYPLTSALQLATYAARLQDVLALESQVLPVVVALESAGILIDPEALERAMACRQRALDALEDEVSGKLGLPGLHSPLQVRRSVASRLGRIIPRLDHECLNRFRRDEAIAGLLRWLDLTSTNPGEQIQHALLRSTDGRVRPSWNQISGPTGRLTSRWPNLQGLHRAYGFRSAVIAPPGRSLVIADYSTIELRIAAAMHGEQRLIDAFNAGQDPHQTTASLILGTQPEAISPEQRGLAKAINFGLLYGMGARSLADHVRDRIGVEMSEARAKSFIDRFFRSYPRFARERDRARRRAKLKNGTLISSSASGRIHRLPRAHGVDRKAMLSANARSLMSSPIQGTCADGLKSAMVLLAPRLRALDAQMIMGVHDEILVECPSGAALECKRVVEQAMIEGMLRWVQGVPIEVQSRASQTWSKES